MTAVEKRQRVAKNHITLVVQKNIYSQDAVKREYAFAKYTDGNYYSDCSSSVRHATERADPSTKPLGGNTVAQYQNKNGVVVDCKIVSGIPTDVSKLRVGDCLYFAGADTARAYADYVGHVEQVHSIIGNRVMLYGHGSGNPRITEMVDYCKKRQNTKSNTKKGNRGLLRVLRFIKDDGESAGIIPETTVTKVLGDRTLKCGMSGDDVKELQRGLKTLGLFGGSIGGNYLEITMNAVKAFQKKYGLDVDGEFGAESFKVFTSLLSQNEAESLPVDTHALVTTANVYLRLGPNSEYADEGTVKSGTKLNLLVGEEGKPVTVCGWYAVIVNKAVLWVSGKYIKMP